MDLSFSASSPSSSLCVSTIPHCSTSQLHKNPVRPTCKSALFCSLKTSLQNPFSTSFNASPFPSISGRPISPKLQIRTPKRRHSARFAIWKQCTCDTSLCNLKRQQTMSFALKEPRLIEHYHSHTWAQARSSFSSQDSGACSQIGAPGSDPLLKTVLEFKDAFWRFLRPHTIRGTALGSTALVTRALIENSHLINWWLLPKALFGLLALICGNGYIVGINQIYDIGIDKVNKPYLPIAAGDLSVRSAWFLVLLFAVAGLLIVGLNFGPFISSLYCLGLFLGTIYSVPPFRLKRFAVAAFLIVATVRGFLLNFGVYYATRAALGLTFEWSPPVAFITVFVTIFALVIAITKDLPDVEGDRKFQISTLATKLGVRNIAFLGSGLLLMNYVGAIVAAVYMPQAFRRSLMIPAHTILALVLIFQAWILERANHTKEAISEFYRFIWNLFYAEYMIFPVI